MSKKSKIIVVLLYLLAFIATLFVDSGRALAIIFLTILIWEPFMVAPMMPSFCKRYDQDNEGTAKWVTNLSAVFLTSILAVVIIKFAQNTSSNQLAGYFLISLLAIWVRSLIYRGLIHISVSKGQ